MVDDKHANEEYARQTASAEAAHTKWIAERLSPKKADGEPDEQAVAQWLKEHPNGPSTAEEEEAYENLRYRDAPEPIPSADDWIRHSAPDPVTYRIAPSERAIYGEDGAQLLQEILSRHLALKYSEQFEAGEYARLIVKTAPWIDRDGRPARGNCHRMMTLQLADLACWASTHPDVPKDIHLKVAAAIGAEGRDGNRIYDHGLNRLRLIASLVIREGKSLDLGGRDLYDRLARIYPDTTPKGWAKRIREAYRGGLPALRKDLGIRKRRNKKQ